MKIIGAAMQLWKEEKHSNKQTSQLKSLLHRCEALEIFHFVFSSSKRLRTRQNYLRRKAFASVHTWAQCCCFFHLSIHLSTHLFHSIQFIWIKCQLHWVKYSPGEPKNKAAYTCVHKLHSTAAATTTKSELVALALNFYFVASGPTTDHTNIPSPLHSFTGGNHLLFLTIKKVSH